MLLTLSATCLRSMLKPASKGAKPALALTDLPNYTREVLGLRGLSLSTDLLVGADRKMLDTLRERGDKAGCACLTLVEPPPLKINAASETAAAAIIDRMSRVVQAAQILGCSSAAFHVEGVTTEKDREVAAGRLKQIVQRGEKLDVNILLGPAPGTPIEPDMLTDVLKRVGGFRVGTFPDFESASKAKDPMTYLRRLSPYASAVCAATLAFEAGAVQPPAPKAPSKQAAASALARLAQALAEIDEAEPPAPPKGKKGKAAAAPVPTPIKPPPEPKAEEEDELDEELDGEDLMLSEEGDEGDEEPEPELLPNHVGYDLVAMVAAVASVGYDGALLVDYRGAGDVTIGVQTSRKVLQAALDAARNAS
ncbi:MAG: TIM barrel protein [Tepidisphaera sp.]